MRSPVVRIDQEDEWHVEFWFFIYIYFYLCHISGVQGCFTVPFYSFWYPSLLTEISLDFALRVSISCICRSVLPMKLVEILFKQTFAKLRIEQLFKGQGGKSVVCFIRCLSTISMISQQGDIVVFRLEEKKYSHKQKRFVYLFLLKVCVWWLYM